MQGVIFESETYGRLTFDQMIEKIVEAVKAEPKQFYRIIIGSDSSARSPVAIVLAVALIRVGKGGIRFLTRTEVREFSTLRDRIWQEAISAITLRQEVSSRLREELGEEFFWDGNQVHVDIGRNGPTNELIDGIVGMIRGYGFEPVIKPDSFVASTVADRYT